MDGSSKDSWRGADQFQSETAESEQRARKRLIEPEEGDGLAREDNRTVATLHYGETEDPDAPIRAAPANGAAFAGDKAAPSPSPAPDSDSGTGPARAAATPAARPEIIPPAIEAAMPDAALAFASGDNPAPDLAPPPPSPPLRAAANPAGQAAEAKPDTTGRAASDQPDRASDQPDRASDPVVDEEPEPQPEPEPVPEPEPTPEPEPQPEPEPEPQPEPQASDTKDAPTAVSLDGGAVAENAAGAIVGAVTVADPDAGDTHSLTASDDRFEIVDGQLKLKDGVSLDHESEPVVSVTVTATDTGGLSKAETFEIAVGDVNEAPTAVSLDGGAVAENAAGAIVGAVTVADPDAGDTHSLTASDDRFEIVDGQLKLKDGVSLDHEAEPVVSVTVTATDTGGLSKAETFEIAVGDVNEAPTGISLDPAMLAAQPRFGETIELAVRLAGEAYKGDPRYEIVVDGKVVASGVVDWARENSGDEFRTHGSGAEVDDAAADWRDVTVHVPVPNGGIGMIEVRYPNDAYKAGVGDRNLIVDHIRIDGVVLEAEAETVVYQGGKFAGGGGAERMPWQGALKFDVSALFDETVPGGPAVAENEAGAVVGTLTVADPDAGDMHSFAVSDDRFEVANGQLKLKDGVSLDYEAGAPPIDVTVTATDGAGASVAQTFSITTVDVEEAQQLGDGGRVFIDTGVSETSITGGAGDDSIVAHEDGGVLSGGDGNDSLIGGAGDDIIRGDAAPAPSGGAPAPNLLVNGALDHGAADGKYIHNATVEGWSSAHGKIEAWGNGFQGVRTVDGGTFIELDRNRDATPDAIWQDVTTEPGETYVLTFLVRQRASGQDSVEVRFGGELVVTVKPEPGADWQTFSIEVEGAGGAERLEFRELAEENDSYGILLDNISLTVAPEAPLNRGGDDLIDGGAGHDTAIWDGPRDSFRIFHDAETGTFTIRDLDAADGNEGRDTVTGVETFEFGGVRYSAAEMIAEAERQETEGAGFEVNLSGGFRFEYFDFDTRVKTLSDIDWTAEPDHREVRETLDFDNGHAAFAEEAGVDTFALRATGTVTVEEGGVFDFRLSADDGAALYVNGELVADNDGDHGFRSRTGSITLAPGEHDVEIRYFENFGSQGLKLEWKEPGDADFSLLEADSALTTETDSPITLALDVEPGGWTVEGVALSGLPAGTILTAGEHIAVAGEGELDATGWSLDHLEITPPAGFAGMMSLEVTVTGEDPAGGAAERSAVFEIEVTPPPGGGAGWGAGGEETLMADGTDGGDVVADEGWIGAVEESGESEESDVLGEDFAHHEEGFGDGSGFQSHETQEP